jgi:hypothetical protein
MMMNMMNEGYTKNGKESKSNIHTMNRLDHENRMTHTHTYTQEMDTGMDRNRDTVWNGKCTGATDQDLDHGVFSSQGVFFFFFFLSCYFF